MFAKGSSQVFVPESTQWVLRRWLLKERIHRPSSQPLFCNYLALLTRAFQTRPGGSINRKRLNQEYATLFDSPSNVGQQRVPSQAFLELCFRVTSSTWED